MAVPPDRPHRNFYGRRKGKHLRDSQEAYLEQDLAGLSPGPVSWEENPERRPLDLDALFGGREVWLEIGFGGGEHMVHQAARNPDKGLIGCEPYINGVAMLLGKIRTSGVENLRVHPGDVRDLFDVLARGVDRQGLPPLSRSMAQETSSPPPVRDAGTSGAAGARAETRGEFRVATDIPDYVRQTLQQVPRHGFTWLAEGPSDWREPWEDWLSTRYEQKALRRVACRTT
jgi:tRNA (guanine-N7-)-methyltransferase